MNDRATICCLDIAKPPNVTNRHYDPMVLAMMKLASLNSLLEQDHKCLLSDIF